MTPKDVAVDRFRGGCACSQAVLAAFAPRFGLEGAVAARLAVGFASGMRRAEICGAVTGAYMVLGLAHGGEDCETPAGRVRAHEAVAAFAADFERRHGALHCKALLGHDVTTPEGRNAAREAGLFAARCERFVGDAAEMLEADPAVRNPGGERGETA